MFPFCLGVTLIALSLGVPLPLESGSAGGSQQQWPIADGSPVPLAKTNSTSTSSVQRDGDSFGGNVNGRGNKAEVSSPSNAESTHSRTTDKADADANGFRSGPKVSTGNNQFNQLGGSESAAFGPTDKTSGKSEANSSSTANEAQPVGDKNPFGSSFFTGNSGNKWPSLASNTGSAGSSSGAEPNLPSTTVKPTESNELKGIVTADKPTSNGGNNWATGKQSGFNSFGTGNFGSSAITGSSSAAVTFGVSDGVKNTNATLNDTKDNGNTTKEVALDAETSSNITGANSTSSNATTDATGGDKSFGTTDKPVGQPKWSGSSAKFDGDKSATAAPFNGFDNFGNKLPTGTSQNSGSNWAPNRNFNVLPGSGTSHILSKNPAAELSKEANSTTKSDDKTNLFGSGDKTNTFGTGEKSSSTGTADKSAPSSSVGSVPSGSGDRTSSFGSFGSGVKATPSRGEKANSDATGDRPASTSGSFSNTGDKTGWSGSSATADKNSFGTADRSASFSSADKTNVVAAGDNSTSTTSGDKSNSFGDKTTTFGSGDKTNSFGTGDKSAPAGDKATSFGATDKSASFGGDNSSFSSGVKTASTKGEKSDSTGEKSTASGTADKSSTFGTADKTASTADTNSTNVGGGDKSASFGTTDKSGSSAGDKTKENTFGTGDKTTSTGDKPEGQHNLPAASSSFGRQPQSNSPSGQSGFSSGNFGSNSLSTGRSGPGNTGQADSQSGSQANGFLSNGFKAGFGLATTAAAPTDNNTAGEPNKTADSNTFASVNKPWNTKVILESKGGKSDFTPEYQFTTAAGFGENKFAEKSTTDVPSPSNSTTSGSPDTAETTGKSVTKESDSTKNSGFSGSGKPSNGGFSSEGSAGGKVTTGGAEREGTYKSDKEGEP